MACCTNCADTCKCINITSSDESIIVNANQALCTWDLILNEQLSTLTYDPSTRILTFIDEKGNVSHIQLANDLQTINFSGTVISLSKGGGSFDISPTFPIFSATSTSLVITSGGIYGNHPNIELVPSTDANNIITLGTDGHPYANYGTFSGISSSLAITPGGIHGLTPQIELVPSIEADNILILGTDGKPYVPVTVIPTFAATSNSLVITPGGSHGSTPQIELVPSTDSNNLITLGTDGKPLVLDNFWKLTGNSGTNPLTNFLGTVDNEDIIFRRNNIISGQINNILNNTSLGVNSLPYNSGSYNISLGNYSLQNNTTGGANVAIGPYSLNNNKIGINNISIGTQAMLNNGISGSDGSGNTAIGNVSLTNNTTGNNNTAIGNQSLDAITIGNFNVGVGYSATTSSGTTSNSIALGANAIAEDNQLAISPQVSKLYIPGFSTGSGYVLTDVVGDGNLSLQPGPTPTGLTLTTSGTSGPATLSGSILNVPVYTYPTYSQAVDNFVSSSGITSYALTHVPLGQVLLYNSNPSGGSGFIIKNTDYSVSGNILTYTAPNIGSNLIVSYIHI